MADRAISELTEVTTVNSSDSFVLQQNNRAMRLTGQTLLNWLAPALDGHGGISTITKTGTANNVDTYKITFADQTTTNFTVTNGRSITSISNPTTSGLKDTYTINYNDNTKSTFVVTNGAKGDKGDKGAKGDKGDNITIADANIGYAVSQSGTEPPSSWGSTVPTVTPGSFLWTRTYIKYSDDTDVTSYSVARHGMDGSGSVRTVHGVSPDSDGDATPISLNGTVLTIGA